MHIRLHYDNLFVYTANKNGYFSTELVPMELKTKKGTEVFVQDEHPRDTTLDKLAKLKPVFKENGLVTAGNASVRLSYYLSNSSSFFYSLSFTSTSSL